MIKKVIPRALKFRIKKYLFKIKFFNKINNVHKKFGKAIIFIAVPTHGNLGDQAIVYSQYKIFEKLGLKKNIVEIRNEDYLNFSDLIQKKVKINDVIVIDGGGNMGTLWIHEEYKMRDIIQKFKENKIIIFPETVFYSEDNFGREEFEKSKRIYNSHSDLHICLRDLKSYNLVKDKYMNANIIYTPDIVLYLNGLNITDNREGAMICIRKDKEKAIDTKVMDKITNKLKVLGLNIKYGSTIVDRQVTYQTREQELIEKWKEFSRAKIVITDRLHGMIFSAITSTPCIALNNCNGKVEGVYEWIKHIPYIVFCNDFNNVESVIEDMLKIDEENLNYNFPEDKFDSIFEIINQ